MIKIETFETMIREHKSIHLCGIGGVSMRALAELLLQMGANVQGSDRDQSPYTDKLESMGVKVAIGHSTQNTAGASLVIRTAAISDENPDIVGARQRGTPIIERGEAWGLIISKYKTAVCISGTHGKTSTTSMVATLTQDAGMDPTVMVGGDLPSIGGNLRIGSKNLFVAEACEYKNSFLSFCPTIAVILNIDRDHLDFFSDTDDIIHSFRSFASLVPEQTGCVIANYDDGNTMRAVRDIGRRVVTFGFTDAADVYPAKIDIKKGFYSFDVLSHGVKFCRVKLSVPGEHNMVNALASAAVAIELGMDGKAFAKGIAAYQGVGRRFEYKGSYHGAMLFDDYAHHPSEIEASLKAARATGASRVICIFQPHTYSRTVSLLNDFARALSHADIAVLTDIYAAREVNTTGVTSQNLCDLIPGSVYEPSFQAACDFVRKNAKEGDLIFTMGAGDVFRVFDLLEHD